MKITRHLLDEAQRKGLLDAHQIEPLWLFLSEKDAHTPRFRATHILYYLGGMIAIGAMTLFMNLGWEQFGGGGLLCIALAYAIAGILTTEHVLYRQHLPIPAGIIATFVVVLTPLAVYGLQHVLGWWAEGRSYHEYYEYIDWRWIEMELATLAVSAILLWRYRLPFLVMPLAVTLWYMSMDLTPFLFGEDLGWQHRKQVSVVMGLLINVLAIWIDLRTRRSEDYAFWLYLFGVMAFWGGLSAMDSHSELGKFLYCCINLGLIAVGAILARRVFAVFGGLGVSFYLGHLAYDVFRDSLLFPFVLTLIGFAVIYLGLVWQRHEAKLSQWLRSKLPLALRETLDARGV